MAQRTVAGRSLVCGTGEDRRSVPTRFSHRGFFLPGKIKHWSCFALAVFIFSSGTTAKAELPIIGKVASVLTPANSGRARMMSVRSETPQWHDSFEAGWAAARQSGRPMLIFITSQDCRFCDAMKRDTLCDAGIQARLANGFVPIILRPDTNPEILARIPVTTYPTTLLAIPRGKVIAHRVGYQPPDRFHELLGLAPSPPN